MILIDLQRAKVINRVFQVYNKIANMLTIGAWKGNVVCRKLPAAAELPSSKHKLNIFVTS